MPGSLVNQGPIKSASDFPDTPEGWAERWNVELAAAAQDQERWHTLANKIVKRFIDKRDIGVQGTSNVYSPGGGAITKLNLFTSNVQTLRSILYGKTPQVSVDRKWSDSNDDVARVAGIIMERLLNEDIETPGDGYAESLQQILEDRLTVGLGVARVRYEAQFQTQDYPPFTVTGPDGQPLELAPGYSQEVKVAEFVPSDYVNWADFRWSPARTWREVRWVAFRSEMAEDDGVKRFGDAFKDVPRQQKHQRETASDDVSIKDPWQRSNVWEIWDRESRKVFWYAEGFDKILDIKDDPLQLPDFLPCPKPFVANLTTSQFMPCPDFYLAQDLYNSIDILETRIDWLVRACKLVGVYDKSAVGVSRMFTEANETEMIPVDNWAMFAEKGGIKGCIDWVPIDTVSTVIANLVTQRDQKIQLLYQVTGMSDIMRGQSEKGATATEQSIKAKFASVRVQALQDEFARFATDLQALKAHIIVAQYDDQKILTASNIMQTEDAPYAQQALQLLRSSFAQYRVQVRPEALAITDYGQMQSERSAAGQALGQLAAAASNPQLPPPIQNAMWETAKWILASFKGSATIEGTWDKALAELQQTQGQPGQQQQVDQAKLQTEQIRAGAAHTSAQAEVIKSRNDLQKALLDHHTQRLQAAMPQTPMEQTPPGMEGMPMPAGAPQ
jgi:hypothetical protein